MKHPNYNDWSDEIKTHYDKIRNKIKKHGHVIQGTVDGKDALERPFAYTIGASFKTGAELLCFFPIKGKGLSIITGIINRILDAVKEGTLILNSQILNDNYIYNLPIAMLVLEEDIKQDVESVWPRQLERDGFLAEFSTNDHKLILLICTDKNGNFPWDEKCESYWPQLCPPPFVAMAQEQLTGDDSLLCRLEEDIIEKESSNKITEDTPIWEIIQHEFINLGKGASVLKKEFSNLILSKYPHIKKGTLSAQISIQVINKRARTGYFQCGKERVCGDNKFDFLFEQEDKTLCKYDKSNHGTWEIYKRDDGKLDVRIFSK